MAVRWRGSLPVGLMFTIGLSLFLAGNWHRPVKLPVDERMSVVLPVPVQVWLSAGDRYLAANVGVFRAIVVGVDKLPPETIQALARVQEDVSFLNPAHEDNYYTATAILPWEGQVAAAQTILERATAARPHDEYPPFFLGFNRLHFFHDIAGAVDAVRIAADHAQDPGNRQALSVIAARWAEKGEDPDLAIRVVEDMAKRTRDRALRGYLQQRAQRLVGLKHLREASDKYARRFGRAADSLETLVKTGVIAAIPVDPLGAGYEMKAGRPVLRPAN